MDPLNRCQNFSEVSSIWTIWALSIVTFCPGVSATSILTGRPPVFSAVESVPVYTEPSSVFTRNNCLLSRWSTFDHWTELVSSYVIHADVEHAPVESLDLAGGGVAFLHDQHVGLVSRKNSSRKKKGGAEYEGSD